jgi:7,8-dihydroneopterin aldolase/epimerase/oxygenase
MKKDSIDTAMVELLNMEFYSYHGCFSEEKIIGNRFIVNFSAKTDISKESDSDNIHDALNYQEVYNVIGEEMKKGSNLLENVAKRIVDACKMTFPRMLYIKVQVSKLNPPVGGKVGESRVTLEREFNGGE